MNRTFGKTGFVPFPIGFGCMRLPLIKDTNKIDEEEAIKMIRYGIDNGVNYIDTAYPYHGGESENVVGRALLDGYREKVMLATKSPVWLMTCAEDFEKYLDEQLKKLQTDHIDFYLMHALTKDRWENTILKYNLMEQAEKAKACGKIKHIGFSYHDVPENYEYILNDYDWEFAQIQLNYLDEEYQAGMNGLLKIYEKNMGSIIMEPLLGGKLANLPEKITSIFKATDKNITEAEWALRYLWNKKEVGFMLSGMSTMEQVVQNIQCAKRSSINMLSEEENQTIIRVQNKFKEIKAIPCTSCQYCMPCPHGVNIPGNFTMSNQSHMFDDLENMKNDYQKLLKENDKTIAINCVDCKVCISKCPQNINIPVELKGVHELLK